jgi:hypothetical protein
VENRVSYFHCHDCNEDFTSEDELANHTCERRSGEDRRKPVLELIAEIDRRIKEARRLADKINKKESEEK